MDDLFRELWSRDHWIFDMDGTLTVPVHNFADFKRRMGLAVDRSIHDGMDSLDASSARRVHRELVAWERELAPQSRAQPDAVTLLTELKQRGVRMGILTRNSRDNIDATLTAAGLGHFFDPQDSLGREDATPKPSGDGIERLLARWGADAEDAVMVGDHVDDVRAGRAAGCVTVLVERRGASGWDNEADVVVSCLTGLLEGSIGRSTPHR